MFGFLAASVNESNKASKAERRAAEVERKIESRRRIREQAATLRESQIARAQAVAAGVNTGVAETSGMQGQVSSIQSQAASNVAYSNQVQTGMDVIGMYQSKAAGARQRASNWEVLADISMKVGTMGT
jgi:hypothetical protein